MLTRVQATAIADAISLLSNGRWSSSQLLAVMHDSRIRERRTPAQVAACFAYLAMDPQTRQPTRALEAGPWWSAAGITTAEQNAPTYRYAAHDDCHDCGRSKAMHPFADCGYVEPVRTPAPMPDELRQALRKPTTTDDQQEAS